MLCVPAFNTPMLHHSTRNKAMCVFVQLNVNFCF